MKTLSILIRRNTKLFFKDKGTFFTSLIAPLILLLLFVTFLGSVYADSFHSCIPKGMGVTDKLVDGFVGGWLLSSLLAVCCVTVAFSANMIMVQDKVSGIRGDLTITPVKSSILSLSYYISTALVTGIICLVAMGMGFLYLSKVGWYLSTGDMLYILLDVVLLVLFGTALSSVVCVFIKNQGGVTAITTIVSAAYGFLCGAYMPISSFSKGIQSFIKFLPGTYGTSLLHNHYMRGCFAQMADEGFPVEVIDTIKEGFDNSLYLNDKLLSMGQCYLILGGTIIALIVLYLIINRLKNNG